MKNGISTRHFYIPDRINAFNYYAQLGRFSDSVLICCRCCYLDFKMTDWQVLHIMKFEINENKAFMICPDCGRTWQIYPTIKKLAEGDPVAHQAFEGLTMTGLEVKQNE